MNATYREALFDKFNVLRKICAKNLLIEHPELVHGVSDHGWSLLEHQVLNNRVDRAEILLEAGANPDQYYGNSPLLSLAVLSGHEPLVAVLLRHGANPNLQDKTTRVTPLFHAARQDVDIFKLLIDHGAKPSIKSANGATVMDVLEPPWVREDLVGTESLRQMKELLRTAVVRDGLTEVVDQFATDHVVRKLRL